MQLPLSNLITLLRKIRVNLANEKCAQADIETALGASGFKFAREVRLSKYDIPDFIIDECIALEVKLRGQRKKEIYKQLCRYAEHESIKALVLASNVSMGLPEEINGKPVYFVSLGTAWL